LVKATPPKVPVAPPVSDVEPVHSRLYVNWKYGVCTDAVYVDVPEVMLIVLVVLAMAEIVAAETVIAVITLKFTLPLTSKESPNTWSVPSTPSVELKMVVF
jgi:hypothetical protein